MTYKTSLILLAVFLAPKAWADCAEQVFQTESGSASSSRQSLFLPLLTAASPQASAAGAESSAVAQGPIRIRDLPVNENELRAIFEQLRSCLSKETSSSENENKSYLAGELKEFGKQLAKALARDFLTVYGNQSSGSGPLQGLNLTFPEILPPNPNIHLFSEADALMAAKGAYLKLSESDYQQVSIDHGFGSCDLTRDNQGIYLPRKIQGEERERLASIRIEMGLMSDPEEFINNFILKKTLIGSRDFIRNFLTKS